MKKRSKADTREDSKIIKRVRQSFTAVESNKTNARLEKMLGDFKQDLAAHPLLNDSSDFENQPEKAWRFSFQKISKPIILAFGSGFAFLVILLFSVSVNLSPTWADVEKQFRAINAFSLSIYYKNHIDQRPVFAQLWSSRTGNNRAHTGNHVVFMDKNASVQAFDVKSRRKSHPFGVIFIPLKALQRACIEGGTTLKSLIDTLAGENMIDTTDLVISDSQVAKDLLVFDACSRDTLWWLRIWTLKESKLPVRILKWHRTDGRFIDLQFTYSKDQPDRFFDPQAFSAELNNPLINQFQLMNRFFEDPGGQSFPTPGS